MSEPFLAEIRMMGFNFAPRGWAFCDGQILPINQNQSLYALLGTTYGGDGRTSFALPDLRGRTPNHKGSSDGGADLTLGEKSGQEAPQLTIAQIPAHTHTLMGTDDAAQLDNPQNTVAANPGSNIYAPLATATPLGASVSNTGADQGHNNMQPFLALSFCIAIRGLFPSRN